MPITGNIEVTLVDIDAINRLATALENFPAPKTNVAFGALSDWWSGMWDTPELKTSDPAPDAADLAVRYSALVDELSEARQQIAILHQQFGNAEHARQRLATTQYDVRQMISAHRPEITTSAHLLDDIAVRFSIHDKVESDLAK